MPIVSVSEPFNIPALGGNPAPSGASKLIDLTDVNAGTSINPGAVLTELEPVGGVRQFGLLPAQSGGGTDFVMREWDMSPVLQTPAWTLGDGSGMTQDAGPPAQQLLAPNGQPLAIAAGPGGESFTHTRAAIALSALELPLMLTLDPVGTGQAALAFLPETVAVFDVLFGVATSVNPALFFGDTGSGLIGAVMQAGGYVPLDAAAFAGDKLTVTITAAGADYVISIAGTDYAVSGSNNPILSIVAPDVGTGPVSIGVQVLGAASLPAGHVDGYIYQVSHAGSFGGKSTAAGDFVYPYDQNGLVIIRLPVNQDNQPGNSQISKLIDLTDVDAGSSNPGAVLTELAPVAGVRQFGFELVPVPDITESVNSLISNATLGLQHSIDDIIFNKLSLKADKTDLDPINSVIDLIPKPLNNCYKPLVRYDNAYPYTSEIGQMTINQGNLVIFPFQIFEDIYLFELVAIVITSSIIPMGNYDIGIALYDSSGLLVTQCIINPNYQMDGATLNYRTAIIHRANTLAGVYSIAVWARNGNITLQSIKNGRQNYGIDYSNAEYNLALSCFYGGSDIGEFPSNLNNINNFQAIKDCPRILMSGE